MVVAGHDLKFFTPLIAYLRRQPGIEVRVDQWAALGEHDEARSRELAGWADVVICGLDNRLARMFVNSSCTRMGRTWIDGAIEGLAGIVRVFMTYLYS